MPPIKQNIYFSCQLKQRLTCVSKGLVNIYWGHKLWHELNVMSFHGSTLHVDLNI